MEAHLSVHYGVIRFTCIFATKDTNRIRSFRTRSGIFCFRFSMSSLDLFVSSRSSLFFFFFFRSHFYVNSRYTEITRYRIPRKVIRKKIRKNIHARPCPGLLFRKGKEMLNYRRITDFSLHFAPVVVLLSAQLSNWPTTNCFLVKTSFPFRDKYSRRHVVSYLPIIYFVTVVISYYCYYLLRILSSDKLYQYTEWTCGGGNDDDDDDDNLRIERELATIDTNFDTWLSFVTFPTVSHRKCKRVYRLLSGRMTIKYRDTRSTYSFHTPLASIPSDGRERRRRRACSSVTKHR